MMLLSLKDVSLKFGEQIIFNELNFELKKINESAFWAGTVRASPPSLRQ